MAGFKNAVSSDKAQIRHDRIKERFQRLIEEATIHAKGDPKQYIVMMSLETENGGKADVPVEMPPYLAAVAIVDKTHRIANPEETQAHLNAVAAARKSVLAREASLDLRAKALQKNLRTLADMEMSDEDFAASEAKPPASPAPAPVIGQQ